MFPERLPLVVKREITWEGQVTCSSFTRLYEDFSSWHFPELSVCAVGGIFGEVIFLSCKWGGFWVFVV